MPTETQSLKPFKASYVFSLEAHDLACARKQQRDLLEAAEDLGFVLEHMALGESDRRDGVSVSPRGAAADAPSGRSADIRPREGVEVRIASCSGVAGGTPILPAGYGVRVVDLLDRVRAGDRVADVAADFDLPLEQVALLVRLGESLALAPLSERSVV